MDENRPDRRRVGSLTLTALLGLFVVAILLALASRLLPGRLSRLARRALRSGEDAKPPRD